MTNDYIFSVAANAISTINKITNYTDKQLSLEKDHEDLYVLQVKDLIKDFWNEMHALCGNFDTVPTTQIFNLVGRENRNEP